jgi:predicted ATPase/DNA-binding winged helix-turn-helix (wHTH) protein
MPSPLSWSFPPFRLDAATGSLWREDRLIPLPPKPLAVLAALVAQAGQVVTKEALLDTVWPETAVTEGVLKGCIRQIRLALGETGAAPQYIATVHRRGYRFLAPVTPVAASEAAPALPESLLSPPSVVGTPPLLVGREAELAQLRQWWAQARQGTRQVVCITGEAGIGKTTLVDAFVAQVAPTAPIWLGHGQCLEQHGAGEPYLPLLAALGGLGRGPDGPQLVAVLRQQAPSWLLHLPALVPEDDFAAVQRRGSGETRERMLRELAEAVEALTAVRPVVLVLEDLHWSDAATVDWLAYVARRREAARLLVLGTYRRTEAIMQGHPIHKATQELQRHGQGHDLGLGYFPEAVVAAYLARRLGTPQPPAGLVRALHQRTTGNPLFLVAVVDTLVRQVQFQEGGTHGAGGEDLAVHMGDVPDSLRQLIEQQLVQLAPEVQALLEAASVVGKEFAVAAVAAAVGQAVEGVEDHCRALARQGQFLRACGTDVWPDGTVAERYGFVHDLYRETLYARVPVGRRVRWHRQIGRRLEAGYGPQARERAAELAEHFVRGHDTERAVPYLRYAGEQAVQRSAHQEALVHLTKGLELLATLPATPARAQQEIDLQLALGPALRATRGYAATEVEQTYTRALALCQQIGETPQLFPTLRGLWLFYSSRGALATARELGAQLVQQAQYEADPVPLLEAHEALGTTLFHLGEYAAARMHYEQVMARTNLTVQPALARCRGAVLGVTCLAHAALTLWCLGYPAQAVQRSQEALRLAQALAHPHSLAVVQFWAASLQHRRREAAAVQAQTDALLTLATAQGFPLWAGLGTCLRGWALAMQGQGEAGMAQLRQGIAAVLATGQELARPLYLVLLAEVMGYAGQVAEGLCLLTEALTAFETSGRGDALAEVYRIQGELLLRQAIPDVPLAQACFQQACAVARHQQAKSWELRAATSLSRLWLQQGKRTAAYDLLAPIYGWFSEGFETADLQEAQALLAELA